MKVIPRTKDIKFILLACDGLWDMKTSEEAIKWCNLHIYNTKKSPSADALQQGIANIVDECCVNDLGASGGLGADNITACLVEFL